MLRISTVNRRSSAGGYALVFLCSPLAHLPVASERRAGDPMLTLWCDGHSRCHGLRSTMSLKSTFLEVMLPRSIASTPPKLSSNGNETASNE